MPLLTIRKVRAAVSLTAAFKKEFVVRSLTVEKPVVTIARGRDGQLNLPKRDKAVPAEEPSDAGGPTEAAGTWTFEAQQVLVVDAEVHYRDADGYHFAIEKLLAEVKDAGSGLEFTVIADSAGRRDRPVEVGQLRANGRADDVPNLVQWQGARIHATLELADMFRVRVDVPSVNPIDVKAEFNGAADVAQMVQLLPKDVSLPVSVQGRVDVLGRATYRRPDGLRVPELTVRASDVSVR